MIKIVIIVVLLLLLAYALKGRAWLKQQPWAQGYFAFIEPLEMALYKKSETLLVSRLLSVGGIIVTAYDALAVLAPSFDLAPITNRLLAGVPEDMRGLVVSGAMACIGLVIAWLRKRTTKPLEVVALPETVPLDVAQAVATAEAANAQAVDAVATAKASGAV